jgi:hypothetical protein
MKQASVTWDAGFQAAAHLVTLKVTERLHGDGFERCLPAELEGHHLLPTPLQSPHYVLILVQSLLLVLRGGGGAWMRLTT